MEVISLKQVNDQNLKLSIELVPSTVWYSSIYQYYTKENKPEKWNKIKRELFAKEGKACFICKKETKGLEAHEFWIYDDKRHIQKLEAIHHLCRFCHKIKHIGLWLHTADGERMLRTQFLTKEDIINHFCKVNNCTRQDFQMYKDEAFRIWNERSKHDWKQDFGKYSPELKQNGDIDLTNFM